MDRINLFHIVIYLFFSFPFSLSLQSTSLVSCSFPTKLGTFDLSSLSTVRLISREDSSRGWLYLFNTCENVNSQGPCGDSSFSPAVQVTSGGCHSLGRLDQRAISPFTSESSGHNTEQIGVTVSFQGGSSCGNVARNISITVLCADVERATSAKVLESKTIGCSYIASVESRAGCPIECARDPKTGAVCGGRERGTCNSTTEGVSCVCAPGKSGKSCSDENDVDIRGHGQKQRRSMQRGDGDGSTAPVSSSLFSRGIVEVDIVACIAFLLLFFLLRHRGGGVSVIERTKRLRYAALLLLLLFVVQGYRLTSVSSELVLSTPVSYGNLQNTLQSNVQLGHPINSIKCSKSTISSDLLKDGTIPSLEMNEGNVAHVAERFKKIYEQSEWGEDGQGSGMGSSLEQTNTLRVILEMVIYRFAATSFLDTPCGSAFWWKELLPHIRENIPCFRYHGVDVAPLAIERAKALHSGDMFTTFTLGDVSRVPLPVGVDLALCRDALQHLPMSEAVRLLRNLAAARPKHVLLGSYSSEHANVKINVGE
jgi:hypothetical protein